MSLSESWGCGLFLSLLLSGLTTVMLKSPGTQHLIQIVQEENIQSLIVLAWNMRQFLQYRKKGELLFPKVKCLISSSAFSHPAEKMLIRKYFTPNLFDAYATTEFWNITVAMPEHIRRYPDSVGKPFADVEIQIVDKYHKKLPIGETGLVRVHSLWMIQKYVNDEVATAECFKDGYYYPMDLGYLNQEGFLFLQGRSDNAIQCRGALIFPAELERVIGEYVGAKEVCVFPWADPDNGQVVAVAIASEQPIFIETLNQSLQGKISRLKFPTHLLTLNALPQKRSGKIDVDALKTALQSQIDAQNRAGV